MTRSPIELFWTAKNWIQGNLDLPKPAKAFSIKGRLDSFKPARQGASTIKAKSELRKMYKSSKNKTKAFNQLSNTIVFD